MLFRKKKRVVGIGIMLVLTAFVGMTANVSANEIPVADAGGPYIADEAGVLIFEGYGFDPDGDPLQYNWYINGTWIGWSDNPDVEYTWFDDYSGEVTLKVTDGDLYGIDTTTVTVLNIIPTDITVTGPYQVFVGAELALWVTFFDGDGRSEGSADTYTAIFDWADDSFSERDLAALEFSFPGDHTYNVEITEPTIYLIEITITDDDGGQASVTFPIVVIPLDWSQLVHAGPDKTIDEGSMFISAGFLADSEGTSYNAIVDYGDGTEAQNLTLNSTNGFDLQHHYCENGVYTVLVTVFNGDEEWGSDSATVTANNVPPTIESLTGPPTDPVQIGTPIILTGVFSDPGCLDTLVATIEWGDGETSSINVPFGTYLVTGSHTYVSAGVYMITLTVTDDDGGSDTMSIETYIVVYDPSGGFVTGGGWIIVPQGSYPDDPSLSGRANFGFVAKYKKGQSIPTGNTEFQFQVGNLNFHSHTYEWLVIAGPKAMYKGVGTINGAGNYGFKLTAIEGQMNGGGGVDKFRIKIWDIDNNDLIVFDNNLGAPDDENPSTVLSGGQITIHKA